MSVFVRVQDRNRSPPRSGTGSRRQFKGSGGSQHPCMGRRKAAGGASRTDSPGPYRTPCWGATPTTQPTEYKTVRHSQA